MSEPLLDGIENLLSVLLKEAGENERELTDGDGNVVKLPAVSFEERLKLVATCTKFLESKVKITPPPPEPPSAFEEMLNGNNGTAVSQGDPGQKTASKKRGRSRLPQSQFDPDNGRAGGEDLHPANGSHGFAAIGITAGPSAAS